MPRTAQREHEVLNDAGRCHSDVVSCVPPPQIGSSGWTISVRDEGDVIVPNEDGLVGQACSCSSVIPYDLSDVFGADSAEALSVDEPAQSQARPTYRGEVQLDPAELALRVEGSVVTLTRTQFSILSYLIHNAGRWITTGELIRQVLGTHHQPDTSLVRVHVHAIRRRLGARAVWLESDRRRARGYRWRQFDLSNADEAKSETS